MGNRNKGEKRRMLTGSRSATTKWKIPGDEHAQTYTYTLTHTQIITTWCAHELVNVKSNAEERGTCNCVLFKPPNKQTHIRLSHVIKEGLGGGGGYVGMEDGALINWLPPLRGKASLLPHSFQSR